MVRRALFVTTLLGVLALFSLAQAQDNTGRRGGRNRAGAGAAAGEQGAQGRRGSWDPAQMRERMLSNIKEQMGATDDEWKTLQPKLEKVVALQDELRPVRTMFSGRGRGGNAAAPAAPADGEGKVAAAQRDLRTALQNKEAPADDLGKKVAAVREARQKAQSELKEAQKDLKSSVNARQEAVLVLMGQID